MNKALKKFSFDKDEYINQLIEPLKWDGGLRYASKKGHGAVGMFFGPAGAAGARAKNTGESKLAETAAAGATAGGTLGTVAGLATLPVMKELNAKQKAAVIAAMVGVTAAGGVVSNSGLYGAGHLFGRRNKPKNKNNKKKGIK